MAARRVLLVGPPGAGKGTQAGMLAERMGVPHVASGDLLREAKRLGTPAGLEAAGYMDQGDLVPDTIVIACIQERLGRADAEGFVLDGFPRTAGQARALDDMLERAGRALQVVVLMEVDEDELVTRVTGRRTCPTCQRPYHMTHNRPVNDEVCDEDGTPLETRPDDTPEKFLHRVGIFKREANELVGYYASSSLLVRVDGMGLKDEVAERLQKVVDEAVR